MRPFPGFRHLPVLCTAAWLTVAAILGNAITSSPADAASAPKKLVVIGATAKSSQEIIWQALAAGYQVTGVARNPAQVELRHERLRMLQGDVYDANSIAAALDGDEVVVSMVGPRVDPTKEVTSMDLFTKGMANIIAAMKKKGNKRLLVASSLGVENQGKIPKEKPPATDPSVMWLWNSRLLYADMKAMEDLVRASGLEYVIFRPGFIIEQPAKHDLKFSVDQESPKGRMVSYADFAEFVLDQADSRKYLGKTVGIYSDRELKFGVTADFAQLSAGMAERAAGKAPPPPPPTGRGNVARGRGLAETCVPCHGETGVSPSPAFPIIAGQQYDYLVSAMLAYLSGTRQDSIMGGAIRTLSRSDIEDLAAFFSTQKPGTTVASAPNPPAPQAGGAPPGALSAAMAAADAARALPAVVARRNSTSGDARELKACAAAANGLPNGFAVDADGDGFLGICNAAQLQALGQTDASDPNAELNPRWQRNYELVADINLTGVTDLQPIGNCGRANNCMISRDKFAYAGQFDGNGHTIRGLRLFKPDTGGVGLFGTLGKSGLVSRLVLRDAQVTGSGGAGLLVGANFGRIADCDVQGRVEGRLAIGGVTGGNAGRLERIRAKVEVIASAAVGGLVGDMNGMVIDSAAEVRVRATGKGVGGLVGLSTFGTVERSSVSGSVTGSDNVGGAVGVNTDALLSEVSARVDVTASSTNAGGLVGYNSQSLARNARATGNVRAVNAAGALVGRNVGAIVSSFANGKVTAESNAGGLVGDNANGTIHASFALKPEEFAAPVAQTNRWDPLIWDVSALPRRLPRLRHLPWVAGPSDDAAGPLANTARPFAQGDVIVAATVMNNPDDDHAGAGRLIQYDADLNFKGELWLKGTGHKVGGLTFGPDKTLWAMSQLTPAVVEIAPNAMQRPYKAWSERKLSSVTFAPDGTLYFGEHMVGKQTGHPSVTTKFKLLADRDVIGDGHLFQFTRDGRQLREFNTATNGGVFGFLGCTSTVLKDNGKRLLYVSETGKVVKQYDLANDRQLPDLARFDKDPDMPMVLVMNVMPDGNLLISNAAGFVIMDPDNGKVLRNYKLEGMGWAAVNAGFDGQYAFTGNFWTGEVVKVRLSDGAVVARANVGQRESLSGIAQFPGP